MRRAAIAVAGLVCALLLPGCASACPAIGWNNALTIDSSAYGPDVFVQVCSDAGCSAAPGAAPTPQTDFSVPAQGDAGTFSFGFAAPEQITVRVHDSAGILLSESEETVDWTHSPGPCGGPSTAAPLVLTP
ncbi:hypothetical protein [Microbacterium sp. H83]|uniref:hypothetical protein n=1 Tax=Microbacterium sp. H83 TaxID=1827324 RepID=UPI000A60BF99|nr:hypothetical protein [Microbacterium sp. H83]